jgi:hypothetical protein
MHLVAFKAHACDGHASKVGSVSGYVYSIIAMFGSVEIIFVNVQREPCVIVIGSNLRARSGGFTGSKIEKADLVPIF